MELLVILIYAAILGLAAPYVNVHSRDYGQLVPSALALNAGAILWGILVWTGIGATNVNFAFLDATPEVSATLGANVTVNATGIVDVAATATFDDHADSFGVSAGGLAVGVHSTQFEIREPQHGLFKPVLELAACTIDEELIRAPRPLLAAATGRYDDQERSQST